MQKALPNHFQASMINTQEDISIRSEEVQEILGTPPGWLTRWGSTLALVAFVVLGWTGYLLKYPDAIQGSIRVTTAEPPRKLVAEQAGFIAELLVVNEDTVEQNEPLLVLRNSAKTGDVLTLENILDGIKRLDDASLYELKLPMDLILDEPLQEAFFDFIKKQEALRSDATGRYDNQSTSQLNRRIEKARALIESEKRQKENLNKDLAIVRERYQREQNLYSSKLITLDDVRETQTQVLAVERNIQSLESSIKNKQFEIEIMRGEISGMQRGSRQGRSNASNDLKESFNRMQGKVEEWKKNYLLISPLEGIVVFSNENIGAGQYVSKEKDLMSVYPVNTKDIIGRIALDFDGSGKVEVGQKVVVKFNSYPFPEFGAVMGSVASKGKVASNGKIPIVIEFPKGLRTTTGRILEPVQEMLGTAEIITEEKRFIEWIFENLRRKLS